MVLDSIPLGAFKKVRIGTPSSINNPSVWLLNARHFIGFKVTAAHGLFLGPESITN